MLRTYEIDVAYLAVPLLGAQHADFQSAVNYAYWLRRKVVERNLPTTAEIDATRARLPEQVAGRHMDGSNEFEKLIMLIVMLLSRVVYHGRKIFSADGRRTEPSSTQFFNNLLGIHKISFAVLIYSFAIHFTYSYAIFLHNLFDYNLFYL